MDNIISKFTNPKLLDDIITNKKSKPNYKRQMDVIRDMQAINTPTANYPSAKQLGKFYDNFIEGKYYGYWSKRFS